MGQIQRPMGIGNGLFDRLHSENDLDIHMTVKHPINTEVSANWS